MTVIVDNFRVPKRIGRISSRWSHLTADTKDELHEFAANLGLQRSWFQDKGDGRWHYDVTDSKREQAVRLGAKPVDIRELGAFVSERRQREREFTALIAPLPGEAAGCPSCGSRIGLTRHGRIAIHNWPATPIRCPGSGASSANAKERS